MLLLPATETASRAGLSRYATTAVAIAFSMIVEMTSLTPRVTLSKPAMPAHTAPTNMATAIVTRMRRNDGRLVMKDAPATTAAIIAASRYCPSTPILNSRILKPIATATADR
jgi:hypothetical protein